MNEQDLNNTMFPEAQAKPEYIICAAIHFDDGINYLHQPNNIETGLVMCGRRHHNIWYNWAQVSQGKTKRKDTQGFVTSKDRFVNRKEGAAIAFAAGQISKPNDCLFSEDLY